MDKLTSSQKKLYNEVKEIFDLIGLDYGDILNYDEDIRTVRLQTIRRQIILSEVVFTYTFINEMLADTLCRYFFKKPNSPRFIFWRRKKFKLFNHYILDEMYVMNKLNAVNAIKKIPREIQGKVAAINDLRNALTHSFFPENRRRHMGYHKVLYEDKDIFTKAGIEKFCEDSQTVKDYLYKRAHGR